MSTNYTPTIPVSGIYSSPEITQNFNDIKTALERLMNLHGDSDHGQNALQVTFDLNNQRVINAADPVDNNDVMTKGYGDSNFGGAAAAQAAASAAAAAVSETNAATSESNAATSEANASTSETNASTSETNAAASAVLASQWASLTGGLVAATDYSSKEWAIGTTVPSGSAKEWAVEAEDVVVAGGEYSAYHWAQKAAAAAATGVTKISVDDTTPAYLDTKLVADTSFTFVEQNPGANETLLMQLGAAAVADFTKGGARYYPRNTLSSFINLTFGVLTAVAAPSANAKAVLVQVQTELDSDNAVGVRQAVVYGYSDAAGTSLIRTCDHLSYEQVAIAPGTTISRHYHLAIIPVDSGNFHLRFQLRDASNRATAGYQIVGYWE